MTKRNKGLTIPIVPPPMPLPSIQQNRGYVSKNARPVFHNHETLNESIDYIMEENSVSIHTGKMSPPRTSRNNQANDTFLTEASVGFGATQ
jgi:hypothetical protein